MHSKKRWVLDNGLGRIFSKNEKPFYINYKGEKSFEKYINIMEIH